MPRVTSISGHSWANWLNCSSSISHSQPHRKVKVLFTTSSRRGGKKPHVICYSIKCSYLHNLAGFNKTASFHCKTYSDLLHLHFLWETQKVKYTACTEFLDTHLELSSPKIKRSVSFKMQDCFTELSLQILLFFFFTCACLSVFQRRAETSAPPSCHR